MGGREGKDIFIHYIDEISTIREGEGQTFWVSTL